MTYIGTMAEWVVYVIPFLVVFTVLVFFHELGHYLAARRNGVGVEVFSIGFGPKLFGIRDARGTLWQFCIIPLGGYIKMFGDADAASTPDREQLAKMSKKEREESIHAKSPLQQIEVSAAGPFANYFVAFLIFAYLFSTTGKKELDPVVGAVTAGGVAEQAGFLPGDTFETITILTGPKAGRVVEVENFRIFQKMTNENPGETLQFDLTRDDKKLQITAIPATADGSVGYLGVTPLVKVYGVFEGIYQALKMCWDMTIRTLASFGAMLTGHEDSAKLGGLMMMAKYAHDFSEIGIPALLEFMAILSLNLGLLNLFPIPMLDGGHILFSFIQLVRGKPVPEKIQDIFYKAGFVLLIGLMIYAQFNDFVRFKVFNFFS